MIAPNTTIHALTFRSTFCLRLYIWQLDTASAILQGEDLILDAGTGYGKSLVFSLPLLLDNRDIVVVVYLILCHHLLEGLR